MLQECFGFSAIVPPAMGQADSQRFAFLRLQKLDKGMRTPKWTEAELRQLGAGLVGRITESWTRWSEVVDLYRQGLERVGHEQRGQDQFGTLLAAAYVLLSDDLPDHDSVDVWCEQLKRENVAEYEGNEAAWQEAWRHILSSQPDAWRTHGSPTVAQRLATYWWTTLNAGGLGHDREQKLKKQN
jgi:hypothetical protein